ncbi:DegT/DnrJ/EryC1/StrS family aminotransferase [Geothermobacter hydrogeniphilus]|uniref:Aminotransferase n=1 Tax=Geothermobacter hydrogeniphilus TaxID=1969733 RepID=A0A1X0XSI1_9BACT|nr:DegT/DnrJ/EryC1/StrS aminotransferase family protein [Geothermobacter hydrogeniphilus]ORJ55872.1 aminotransferase [Geothermobacter hydrogeniphilus]
MTINPFPTWPSFTEEEADAVRNVLLSNKVNYWTGTEGRAFEKEFAAACGTPYAVALANGTLALELALESLGIGAGDEVITTSYTFIASASAIVMRGAVPVIADVEPDSLTISAATIRPLITPRTRAIIPVHLAGWPCDMDPIMELAREHDLKVIEDCAQAHGARYKGRPVGSLGDAAAFSFCQDKIMTTGGEGGMLVTSDKAVWEKAWSFKDHGKSFDAVYNREHQPGFRWLHESFGSNWRLTEMQAAIGRIQLRRLPEWTAARQRNAALLDEAFRKIPALRVPETSADIDHAYYKYYVFVRPERLREGWDRDRIMNAITAEGIPCFSGICPEIYLEKAFTDAGFGPKERLPNARRCGETSLLFLVHPTLGKREMAATCRVVTEVMARASR